MKYVGTPVSVDPDVAYKSYVEALKNSDLDTTTIDTLIDSALSSYATVSYVDTQDALLVPASYVDAQDNLRIKTASKDVPNGVAGLDATGKVDPNRINLPTTQKYWRGPWTPSAYNGNVTNVSTETDLYSVPVTDPGYPYKLVVFGMAEGRSDLAGQWPQINVRVGSTSGTIIAQGVGGSETMEVPTGVTILDDFERVDTTGLGSNWSAPYTAGDSGSGAKIDTADGHNAMLDWTPFFANAVQRHKWAGTETTGVDNQTIELIVGDNGFGNTSYVNILGRITSDWSNWVSCRLGNNSSGLLWKVSGTEYGPVSGIGTPFLGGAAGDKFTFIIGSSTNPQFMTVQKNGSDIYSTDLAIIAANSGQPTPTVGSSHRGWGFGMLVPASGVLPFKVDSIKLTDGITSPNLNTIRIVPLTLNSQPSRTGATTVYVRLLRSGGSSTVRVTNYAPKIFVMAVPA